MLDVLHLLGRRFGDMDRAAAYQCSASGKRRQFRDGHPYRHMRCSLLFAAGSIPAGKTRP